MAEVCFACVMAGLRQQQSHLLRQVTSEPPVHCTTLLCSNSELFEECNTRYLRCSEQLDSQFLREKMEKRRAQVFAQVAKEYLGSSPALPGISSRNVYSRCTQLQRRAFFQNSYKDIPADPKSQASSIQHPMQC